MCHLAGKRRIAVQLPLRIHHPCRIKIIRSARLLPLAQHAAHSYALSVFIMHTQLILAAGVTFFRLAADGLVHFLRVVRRIPVGDLSGTLLSARFSASFRVAAARRRCTTTSHHSAKICSKSATLKATGILRRQRDVASGRAPRYIAVGATLPGPASRWSRGQMGETERNCAVHFY